MTNKTNSDLLKSLIRTVVPVVVGLIVSGFAQLGIEVPTAALSGLIDAVFVGAYYALIRVLETKSPSIGWFLGLPAAPEYKVWTAQGGPLGDDKEE